MSETTFWQDTADSARDAIRLYFQPLRQLLAWLSDDREPVERTGTDLTTLIETQREMEARLAVLEQQVNPAFDSPADLQLRIERLNTWLEKRREYASAEVRKAMDDINLLLRQVQSSINWQTEAELSKRVRQMEVNLGFEKPAKRTFGASGD